MRGVRKGSTTEAQRTQRISRIKKKDFSVENTESYPEKELTERIIGSAMEVHKALGPGLLESAYETALHTSLKPQEYDSRDKRNCP